MISKWVFSIVFILYTFALGLKFTLADYNQYEYKIIDSASELVDIAENIAGIKVKRNYNLDAPRGVRGRSSDNTMIERLFDWF